MAFLDLLKMICNLNFFQIENFTPENVPPQNFAPETPELAQS